MFPQSNLNDITHVIQLAIAPVFTTVAAIIGVLANRLARIVDRIRVLEERQPGAVFCAVGVPARDLPCGEHRPPHDALGALCALLHRGARKSAA